MRNRRARGSHGSGLFARLQAGFSDLFSIEASFTLFLFSGRYKNFQELQWFPVDFTLLFFFVTLVLIAWAVVSGRMRLFPLSLPVLLVILFTEFATASLFWSSLDPLNIDKLWRFAALTSTSFFAAHMLAQEKERRDRLVRMIAWLSAAILLYYVYYRYALGIDMQASYASTGRVPSDADNYLEYNSHAAMLFIMCVALAVYGSWKQMWVALVGAGAMLYLLATIGGRGPLAFAIFAIPLTALSLFLRPSRIFHGLARLSMFVAVLCVIAAATYTVMAQIYGGQTWEHLRTLDRYEMQLSDEDTTSMDERRDARDLAVSQWHQKPLFGWGIGEFRVESAIGYPHNLLLETLMELGLVGTFILLPVCVVAAIECVHVARTPSSGWSDIAIGLLYLAEFGAHLTVEGYLADDRYLFACLGLLVGMGQARRALHQSRRARPAVGYERVHGQAAVARR